MYNAHTQIPAVHIVGNLVWFHPEFMLRHLPFMNKMIDRKLMDQMRSFRQQYLTQRSGQDLARYCSSVLNDPKAYMQATIEYTV